MKRLRYDNPNKKQYFLSVLGAQVPSYVPQNISLLYLLTWCLEIRSVPKKVLCVHKPLHSHFFSKLNWQSDIFHVDIDWLFLCYRHNEKEVSCIPKREHTAFVFCQSRAKSLFSFTRKWTDVFTLISTFPYICLSFLIFLFTEQSHGLSEYVWWASGVTRCAWLSTSSAD